MKIFNRKGCLIGEWDTLEVAVKTGANLSGANLSGADLRNAKNVKMG